MSLNHFSSETLWWTTQQPPPPMEPSPKSLNISPLYHHPPPTTNFNFNLNHHYDNNQESCLQEKEELPKEPMFEKPLTPSDVGKLNRLVIPKQHAEKHFPLGGDSVEKGLLLSFEDESGKSWRFRYSYWNSSQSYVLTKGWSRFVKEKRLDAGDVVLFEKHRLDGDRLFIGWRRRAVVVPVQDNGGLVAQGSIAVAGGGGNNGWTRVFYNAQAYPTHLTGGVGNGPAGFPYQPDCLHAGSNVHNNYNNNNNKRPTTPSGKGRRSVRLFGVNLECETEDYEPATPDGSTSSISSQGQGEAHYQPHMDDMNICRDVNQMRYQYQYQQYHQG